MRIGETTLRHLLRPIQDLLDDPSVTEIVIQKPREVGFEKAGSWFWRDDVPELDIWRLDAIGILAGSLLSKRFDPENPICYTTLPDGQRCTLARPPVTPAGTISITIRIPSKIVHTIRDLGFDDLMRVAATRPTGRNPMDMEILAAYGAQDWTAFFSLAVRARKTIAATGAVGSGKTTFLRRLANEIPVNERLVTIQDTEEMGALPQRNRVSMFYGSTGVTAEALVELSLRQRPDRILMQELRGNECLAYIRALASGHPGGLVTWHAADGDPFTPLTLMVKDIEPDKLKALAAGFIDVVAYCRRDDDRFSVPSVWYRDAEDAA